MNTIEEKNATIKSTQLGCEDHGVMVFYLHLDYGSAGQGFGGNVLDEPDPRGVREYGRRGTAFGMEALRQVLKVTGVSIWEKLPGTPVRVRASMSHVESIGHYLKDEWLNLTELAEEFYPDND